MRIILSPRHLPFQPLCAKAHAGIFLLENRWWLALDHAALLFFRNKRVATLLPVKLCDPRTRNNRLRKDARLYETSKGRRSQRFVNDQTTNRLYVVSVVRCLKTALSSRKLYIAWTISSYLILVSFQVRIFYLKQSSVQICKYKFLIIMLFFLSSFLMFWWFFVDVLRSMLLSSKYHFKVRGRSRLYYRLEYRFLFNSSNYRIISHPRAIYGRCKVSGTWTSVGEKSKYSSMNNYK